MTADLPRVTICFQLINTPDMVDIQGDPERMTITLCLHQVYDKAGL
jgi:hypothetical protein